MTDNIQKLYEIAGVEKKPVYNGSQLYNPFITGYEYPPFTPEKQLELIKWVSNDYCESRNESFEQVLASLILELWQDLTDDQKEEIKRILQ